MAGKGGLTNKEPGPGIMVPSRAGGPLRTVPLIPNIGKYRGLEKHNLFFVETDARALLEH